MDKTTTRFAPSPSGVMHLGNLRVALWNYWRAQQTGGRFLLRFEDSDDARSSAAFCQSLQDDLQWVGIRWDAPPWQQSERGECYTRYRQELQQRGFLYRCFCSAESLRQQRQQQRRAGQAPRYDGRCRRLEAAEAEAREARGELFVWRFRAVSGEEVAFEDMLRGRQQAAAAELGDFVIYRGNARATFLFANAIDDLESGVTEVWRGRDHLSNSLRQIALFQALQRSPPRYGHLSLLLADDGNPLSKRRGDLAVAALREEGFLAAAVQHYLAFIGRSERPSEPLEAQQICASWDAFSGARTDARYDGAQLRFWQRLLMQHLPSAERLQNLSQGMAMVPPLWAEQGEAAVAFCELVVADGGILPKEAQLRALQWLTMPEQWPNITAQNTLFRSCLEQAEALLRNSPMALWDAAEREVASDFSAFRAALTSATGMRGKALMQPLRLALTLVEHGPPLQEVYALQPVALRRSRMVWCQQLLSSAAVVSG